MASQIPVQNIYFLLCYAWDRLDEGELTQVNSETCDTLQDLFAKVLISGTQRLMKQGFHRGYMEEVEETASLRGRIAFSPSVRAMSWSKGRMVCEYAELSYNTIPNRILKTTLRNLLYVEGLEEKHKDQLAGLLHQLHEVSPIRITSKLFRRIQYHQNLRFYRFLMHVCEFVHESLLPTEGGRDSHFRDFIRDERKMAYVFEDFIRNFYRRERPDYRVGKKNFGWQDIEGDDAAIALMPRMETDVDLSKGDQLTILDCKYYKEAFTSNRDVEKMRSGHLYQLYAYIKNRAILDSSSRVSGALLYPDVGQSFCHQFKLQGHEVTVANIDLHQPWPKIHAALKAMPFLSM